LRRYLAESALASVTDHTLTSAATVFDDIALSREHGYFVTRGESVSDVFAVAVPVDVGPDVLGIAIAGPRHRMDGQIERVAAVLLETKRAIEQSKP
jgi:DNA-binding IclR family transcriptional regulator